MLLILAIACIFLIYYMQAAIYKKYWNKQLHTKIYFKQNECVEGDTNALVEIIRNNKALPLPVLHVKLNTPKSFLFKNEDNSSVTDYYYRDDVFSIMGHEEITRNLEFKCSKRGCYYMKDLNLVCYDLFMQNTFNANAINPNTLYVYPRKIDVSSFEVPFKTITGTIATQKTLVEDPFEFKGIREYQAYDSIRNINWKSSAKNNTLNVNTFFMTSSQAVNILLNLDTHLYSKSENIVESAIRIASSLAEKFIHSGIPVSVLSNGKDKYTGKPIGQPAGQGQGHMLAIDNSLARIDTSVDNDSFLDLLKDTFSNADTYSYYIIISNNRNQELVNYYNSVAAKDLSCYFIVPELSGFTIEEQITNMFRWEVKL